MFVKQNKFLLLGTVVVCAVFLMIHTFWVRDNWAEAAKKSEEAETSREAWEKNFKPGENLLAQPDAEKALEDNNRILKTSLQTLQLIEFGTKDTLQPFSEAAAGTGDHKNFLMSKRTTVYNRAKSLSILCSAELGLTDKIADDPVALNLLRLAIVDSVFNDCRNAKVQRINKIQFFPPKLLHSGEDEAAAEGDTPAPDKKADKGDKKNKDAATPERADRLVQFPAKIQFVAAEPAITKLLFELQRPSDRTRGYVCLRGFHVSVRQAGSGNVEAVIGFTALLNEKVVRELGIVLKEEDHRNTPGNVKPEIDRY